MKSLLMIGSLVGVLVTSILNIPAQTEGVRDDINSPRQDKAGFMIEFRRFIASKDILLEREPVTHFTQSIATQNLIVYAGHGIEGSLGEQRYSFLPEVDETYFLSNAVEIHAESNTVFKRNDVRGDGIHVFIGDSIELADIDLRGTLVFMGQTIRFSSAVRVSSKADMPALVFTNPAARILLMELGANDRFDITGLIYSPGAIWMGQGDFSGPVVCQTLFLNDDLSLVMTGRDGSSDWVKGFGSIQDYPWVQPNLPQRLLATLKQKVLHSST